MILHFVRHAAHDNVGAYLAGRTPGVTLGPAGLAQARRLADRMLRERIDRLIASPIERAQQTADAISRACGVPVETRRELEEIDFGRWSGQDFATLNDDAEWRRWNAARALGRTPAGETMFAVQVRVMALIDELRSGAREAGIVLVSHADVIKAALAYFMGISLDRLQCFDIAPASLSTLHIDDWNARLDLLNETVPE